MEVGRMSYREFAYYYDRLMEDMPYPEWIDFVQQCWGRVDIKPKTVVDLGCGTGNITIPLAQLGYHLTGIDLSEDMLSVARQKQEQLQHSNSKQNKYAPTTGYRGTEINWMHQDMTEWELPYKVDAVISFCDCLNYLLEEEQIKQTFHRVFEGLHTGGSFIFDVHTPLQLEEYAEEQPFTWNEEDLAYIWNSSLDSQRCEIEHELTIFAKNISRPHIGNPPHMNSNFKNLSNRNMFQRIDEVHTQRAYSLEWLRVSLEETGFQQINCYSDFTFDPPSELTKRAFFSAIK
jgi:SAM-dependent methyltransferase